jgi:hypothetical protein
MKSILYSFFIFIILTFAACSKEQTSTTNRSGIDLLTKMIHYNLNNVSFLERQYFYDNNASLNVIKMRNGLLSIPQNSIDSFFRDNTGRVVKCINRIQDTTTQLYSILNRVTIIEYSGNTNMVNYTLTNSRNSKDSVKYSYDINGREKELIKFVSSGISAYNLDQKIETTYDQQGNITIAKQYRYDLNLNLWTLINDKIYSQFDISKKCFTDMSALENVLHSNNSDVFTCKNMFSKYSFISYNTSGNIYENEDVRSYFNPNNRPDSSIFFISSTTNVKYKVKYFYQ